MELSFAALPSVGVLAVRVAVTGIEPEIVSRPTVSRSDLLADAPLAMAPKSQVAVRAPALTVQPGAYGETKPLA